jgi:hypothetical protein
MDDEGVGDQVSTARRFRSTAVSVTDMAGERLSLRAGQELVLTHRPIFISDVPSDLARQAQGKVG